jgi:cell division protein FtsI (penicillin-binding protein 3)
VLEYLGVPHDIDLRPTPPSKPAKPIKEDDTPQSDDDIKALYDAANDLPSDDPLSATQQHQAPAAQPQTAAQQTPPQPAAAQPPKTITLEENKVSVPSLLGLPVRKVIEQAAAAGLQVQIVGNGTASKQAPDPGTMVPPGTKIVVRCFR